MTNIIFIYICTTAWRGNAASPQHIGLEVPNVAFDIPSGACMAQVVRRPYELQAHLCL